VIEPAQAAVGLAMGMLLGGEPSVSQHP
jgi:hypothetical protein